MSHKSDVRVLCPPRGFWRRIDRNLLVADSLSSIQQTVFFQRSLVLIWRLQKKGIEKEKIQNIPKQNVDPKTSPENGGAKASTFLLEYWNNAWISPSQINLGSDFLATQHFMAASLIWQSDLFQCLISVPPRPPNPFRSQYNLNRRSAG